MFEVRVVVAWSRFKARVGGKLERRSRPFIAAQEERDTDTRSTAMQLLTCFQGSAFGEREAGEGAHIVRQNLEAAVPLGAGAAIPRARYSQTMPIAP